MIQCSVCKQNVSQFVPKCPECGHVFTQKERNTSSTAGMNTPYGQIAARNTESMDDKIHKEHSKRQLAGFLIGLGTLIALLIAWGVISMICGETESPEILEWLLISMLIVVVIIDVILGCVFHVGRCPRCEGSLGRHSLTYEHCPRCGGKL